MLIKTLLAATALSHTPLASTTDMIHQALFPVTDRPAPTLVAWKSNETGNRKNPRKFHEILQGVQYDGDYAPAAGRLPDPEPSRTVPVRYHPEWEKQIPVIVAPAPKYVDEADLERQNANGGNAQVPTAQADQDTREQAQDRSGAAGARRNGALTPVANVDRSILTSGGGASASEEDEGEVAPAANGSATGSTAVATYGALPK